ncbi:1-acyl-sn-glycerol-3-phosphate acyltransferase [Variovorax sp. J22R115]|uniref:1-acyl-sn-glycerol-3-phosphate acyltransferase n=1 Tax=Variovorax sp. J22R115 TaxID=3053509 RepID=UPI0025749878|nr:1-acyl-sn-glycerol-3-phosphate acyltransferase [Variovorax sp. J22R115]MDM0052563.1 1-acyl-sn-glycerol-3-phosphate acyltransferase [Variovorax sp. J22R115]
MTATASPLVETLTELNIVDLLDSMGLLRLHGTPLRHLFRPAARRFARTAHEFDARVGEHGLAEGSAWLMGRMTAGIVTSGLEYVPPQGPVIILANHPGMTDTVALFTSLASRPDLRVLASDRPFLRALPSVARQLIFLPDEEGGRMAVIRNAVRHLHEGGALLTFPAGEIEPDPATFGPQRAAASLQNWSSSYTLFARLAPRTQFVPALVSHVISPEAQRHPLTLLRRTARNKEKLAAALQVALPRYRDLVARVTFGKSPNAGPDGAQALGAFIAAQMRHLIFEHGSAHGSGCAAPCAAIAKGARSPP